MRHAESSRRAGALAAGLVLVAAEAMCGEPERAPQVDARANTVVHRMADFYTGLRSFSVDVATHRVVTISDKTRDAIVLQTVAMRRPNGFSMVQTGSDGQLTVKSDGATVTTYLGEIRQYIVTPAPEDFAQVTREQQQQPMRLALEQLSVLGALVLEDPYAWIMQSVSRLEYVALEKLDGSGYHHLRLVHEDTDWDLWISSGKMPLLKMMIPDLTRAVAAATRDNPDLAELQLDVTMLFENWSVNADLPDSQFCFAPPPGAHRVERFSLDDSQHGMLGQRAPALRLVLLGGGEMCPASHRGKAVVVLEFWASWSRPCRRRLPIVAGVAARFADRGVVFCAVNQGEDAKTVGEFLKGLGLDVPVAMDEESEAARACHVMSIPQTVVIGLDGTVRAVYSGPTDNLEQALTRELEGLVRAGAVRK